MMCVPIIHCFTYCPMNFRDISRKYASGVKLLVEMTSTPLQYYLGYFRLQFTISRFSFRRVYFFFLYVLDVQSRLTK